MKLCRFLAAQREIRVGMINSDNRVLDLTEAGVSSLTPLLEAPDAMNRVQALVHTEMTSHALDQVQLLCPVERQQVWAAGVTYQRSKKARMEESSFSANAYDRVYEAPRPELFFKSLPENVMGPGDPVGIRQDARWTVPEPELVLVLNSRGEIAGFTMGNDMSSRDIEGENLLYLPQAKIYSRSCAVGPCIVIGADEAEARKWIIRLQILRKGQVCFAGETCVDQIKRPFREMADYLCRSQSFSHGAMLLTGTGIVPEENFSLQSEDSIRIEIDGIGILENAAVLV